MASPQDPNQFGNQQNPYNAPQTPGGQPPYGGEPPKGLAIGSLICGIISIPLALGCALLGVILGIVAIILGSSAKKKIAAGQASGGGLATGGTICGVVGLILGVINMILGVVLMAGMQ